MTDIEVRLYGVYLNGKLHECHNSTYINGRLRTSSSAGAIQPEGIARGIHSLVIEEGISDPYYTVTLEQPEEINNPNLGWRLKRLDNQFKERLEHLLRSEHEFQRSKKRLEKMPRLKLSKIVVIGQGEYDCDSHTFSRERP